MPANKSYLRVYFKRKFNSKVNYQKFVSFEKIGNDGTR